MASKLRYAVIALKPFSGYYASCPNCKKKVREEIKEEENISTKSYWCSKCSQSYSQISLNYMIALTISNDKDSCLETISFGNSLEPILGGVTAIQLHQFMVEEFVPEVFLYRALSIIFLGREFDFEFTGGCGFNERNYKLSYHVVKITSLPDHTHTGNIISIIKHLTITEIGSEIITNKPKPVSTSTSQSLYSDSTLDCDYKGPKLTLESDSNDDDVIVTPLDSSLRKDFVANSDLLHFNNNGSMTNYSEDYLNEEEIEELLNDNWTSLSSFSSSSPLSGGINHSDLIMLGSQLFHDIPLTVPPPAASQKRSNRLSLTIPAEPTSLEDSTRSDSTATTPTELICSIPIVSIPIAHFKFTPNSTAYTPINSSDSSFSLFTDNLFHGAVKNSSLTVSSTKPSPDLFNSLSNCGDIISLSQVGHTPAFSGSTPRLAAGSLRSSTPLYHNNNNNSQRDMLFGDTRKKLINKFHLPLNDSHTNTTSQTSLSGQTSQTSISGCTIPLTRATPKCLKTNPPVIESPDIC